MYSGVVNVFESTVIRVVIQPYRSNRTVAISEASGTICRKQLQCNSHAARCRVEPATVNYERLDLAEQQRSANYWITQRLIGAAC